MAESRSGSGRRSFGVLVLLGAGSSALFAVASSRTWVTVSQLDGQAVFSSQSNTRISGSDLVPWVAALAVVGLAAWGAVLVTRTPGRFAALALSVVAQATAVAGVVIAVTGSTVDDELARRFGDAATVQTLETSWAPWLFVSALAGALAVAAAAYSLVVCRSWPSMGSRYDAPAGRSGDAADPEDFWKQLDAGIDPTE